MCVVGVERETERLTAAKKREHFATQDDEDGESYDHHGKSYDPQAASCDMTEWGLYLNQVLPVDLKSPFHVSLQLNVDSTRHSTDKFSQLLLHLQGNSDSHNIHTLIHIVGRTQISQKFLKLLWSYTCSLFYFQISIL